MDPLTDDKLFVEKAYKLVFPYSRNLNNKTHSQAINDMFLQLNELCSERMLPVMLVIASALDFEPTPDDDAPTICTRFREKLYIINERLGGTRYDERFEGANKPVRMSPAIAGFLDEAGLISAAAVGNISTRNLLSMVLRIYVLRRKLNAGQIINPDPLMTKWFGIVAPIRFIDLQGIVRNNIFPTDERPYELLDKKLILKQWLDAEHSKNEEIRLKQ